MTGGKKAARRDERRRAAVARRRRRRTLIWASIGVGLAVAVGATLFRSVPEALAGVEHFQDLGGGHLADGDPAPDYNSDPPTSGEHSATSAPCGIYGSPIPDTVQVHNLEHGTVIIQYRPDLDSSEIDALHGFARGKQSHILVAPRPGLSSPIAVTSWTRMLRMDSADVGTLDLYYEQFAFTGPEVGVPCAFEIDEAS